MNKLKLLLFCALFLGHWAAEAQDKIYFDRNGKRASAQTALYYRSATPDSADYYKAYYVNGDALYFEGRILQVNQQNELKNQYAGQCVWYYKNGEPSKIIQFNNKGLKNGQETEYYESGKIKSERTFINGQPSREPYIEYSESGEKSLTITEEFDDNFNDWDLYDSDKSLARLSEGRLILGGKSTQGCSRFVIFPRPNGKNYSIETSVLNTSLKKGYYGLILGFKDWENYSFFLISGNYYLAGSVFEGIYVGMSEPLYSSQISTKEANVLKVLQTDEKAVLTINGNIVNRRELIFPGNKYGILVGGKGEVTAERLVWKSLSESGTMSDGKDQGIKSTGSGFFIHKSGYIATNHHVIENAKNIQVEVKNGNSSSTYTAKVQMVDKANDLAILKIEDSKFLPLTAIPYQIKRDGLAEVGSAVFTLGYPLALTGMGKEVKFTDGKISARTGYEQNINSYQTTVPVQPGNSGGPLFNDQGQLVGVVNAIVKNTDNVSYAIKTAYLVNLVELLPENLELPNQAVSNVSLEERIKLVKDLVVIIKTK
ncbi:MAG: trypsin-like peptidase domain-containing protein [Sphingobacteriaceae bacterium]|nr:trypsin-like peptidase domain-containing protein [Sphingobacteriaceae bacterium]